MPFSASLSVPWQQSSQEDILGGRRDRPWSTLHKWGRKASCGGSGGGGGRGTSALALPRMGAPCLAACCITAASIEATSKRSEAGSRQAGKPSPACLPKTPLR